MIIGHMSDPLRAVLIGASPACHRWGSPRVLVLSFGFRNVLSKAEIHAHRRPPQLDSRLNKHSFGVLALVSLALCRLNLRGPPWLLGVIMELRSATPIKCLNSSSGISWCSSPPSLPSWKA